MNGETTASPGASSSDMLSTLGKSISEHPVPSALIGMGLLWMFAAGRGALPRMPGGYQPEGQWSPSRPGLGNENRDLNGLYSRMRESGAHLMEQQPLLLGVLGIAVGAGVAATLPMTSVESSLMGEASASVRQQAEEIVRKQGEVAEQVLDNVKTAVVRESAAQGLTKEELLRKAGELGDKAKRVAVGAAKSVQDKMG